MERLALRTACWLKGVGWLWASRLQPMTTVAQHQKLTALKSAMI